MPTSDQTQHPSDHSLFDEVMKLTRQHFDDDAPEYVAKFLKAHLQKPPEFLTVDDLISMTHWIKSFVAFLENGKGTGEQYVAALLELIPPGKLIAIDKD